MGRWFRDEVRATARYEKSHPHKWLIAVASKGAGIATVRRRSSIGHRLSALKEYGGHVVPLIKLVKAWRNVQMTVRKPKSYLLDVLVLYAVENADLILRGRVLARRCVGGG